jgi:hypothetical protein
MPTRAAEDPLGTASLLFEVPPSFCASTVVNKKDVPDLLKPYSRKQLNILGKQYHPDKTKDLKHHERFKYITELKRLMDAKGWDTVGDIETPHNPELMQMKKDILRTRKECADDIARSKKRRDAEMQSIIPENAAAWG